MGKVARGWGCGVALGLVLVGQGARAHQILFNRSSRPVALRLDEVKISRAVLRIQVHRTGKTPKTTAPTVVVDAPLGERKVFVPEPAGELAPVEVVIARETPDAPAAPVPTLTIPPLGWAHFIRVPVDLPKNDASLVAFALCAVDTSRTFPELVDLNLRVVYGLSTDVAGVATEILFPRKIKQVDGKGAGIPHLLGFEGREPDADHLVIIDPPPPGGCGCAIQ